MNANADNQSGEMPAAEQGSEVDEQVEEMLAEPVDDLDCELEQMAEAIVEGRLDDGADRCVPRFRHTTVDEGRPMAILSYFSVMFGIPVFVLPMVQRQNAFALHHAKASGVIFIACTAMLVAALTNCAFFLPLVFLCYIPALIGVYRATAGVAAGTSALGPAGERIFRRIEVEQCQN